MVDDRRVRIANVSGFYGDRVSAAADLLAASEVDVLTGDWLAELTMWLLAHRARTGRPGYASTFLTQLHDVLPICVERGIKIVSNAGGVTPDALADAVVALGRELGVTASVAVVTGDDLLPTFDDLSRDEPWINNDTGESPPPGRPVTANAYLGAFGIAEALRGGADVVITGRVTDASLVVGPSAWFHGWTPEALDELAGATVAGHIIECGMQATGGNFAFFDQISNFSHMGFPIASVAADGSCIITKPSGTGGQVTRSTVTAQLMYEVDSPRYLGPDVVARFDTVRLEQRGVDEVAVTGARGEPPPERLKVALNYLDGFHNAVTFILTGRDIETKADIVERQLFEQIDGGRDAFISVTTELRRHGQPGSEPRSQWHAQAEFVIAVTSNDEQLAGKTFTSAAVGLTLGSVPGLFIPGAPPRAAERVTYWPSTIAAERVEQRVRLVGSPDVTVVASSPVSGSGAVVDEPLTVTPPLPDDDVVRAPLGAVVGARSGDKGGTANIGVWVDPDRPDAQQVFHWLRTVMNEDQVVELIPEARGLPVSIFGFDNLLALNIVIRGLLGRGVASNRSIDPQGKGLGEYLRAREIEVPQRFVNAYQQGDMS